MKKSIKAIAVSATVLIMYMPLATFANDDQRPNRVVEAAQNNIRITYQGRTKCTVSEGTRLRQTHHVSWNDRIPVRVVGGQHDGCWGNVRTSDIRDAGRIVEYNHSVASTWRWGRDRVPVFKDMSSFFDARDNRKFRNVACHLRKNERIFIKQYKNWGAGTVLLSESGCKGVTDFGIISRDYVADLSVVRWDMWSYFSWNDGGSGIPVFKKPEYLASAVEVATRPNHLNRFAQFRQSWFQNWIACRIRPGTQLTQATKHGTAVRGTVKGENCTGYLHIDMFY